MMQVHINYKHISIVLFVAFFVYLVYLLWGSNSSMLPFNSVTVNLKDLMNYCIMSAHRGGHAIRKIHAEHKLQVRSKGNTREGMQELLTQADLVSNSVIMDTFSRFPGVRLVSEEKQLIDDGSKLDAYHVDSYALWSSYHHTLDHVRSRQVRLSDVAVWIDPLDATQEFTENLLEFVSVMLCVAVMGRPLFGVIHRPFINETVWGLVNHGVVPPEAVKPRRTVTTLSTSLRDTIVVSRSHAGNVEDVLRAAHIHEQTRIEPVGGAGYKTLRVLNGSAHAYVHVTAIKKWDICAGNAILNAADGKLTTLRGQDITYFPDDSPMLQHGLLATLSNHFEYVKLLKDLKIVHP